MQNKALINNNRFTSDHPTIFMNIMKKTALTTLLLFLVSVSSLWAQKKYNELTYPELNKIKKPDITTFTLDNGIKFYLVEDHELPLINMDVVVRTGSVLEPDDEVGLADITGTVMRSGGTKSIPADSLNTLLENKAASMETGIGFTSGSASMNVLKEDFDGLLPVFVDLLQHPAFPQDKIDLAKKHMKSMISRRNDNQSQIANRVFDQLIYGKNSVYGQVIQYATVNKITRDDMVAFHDKSFVGANMMIGVSGDFDTDAMKKKLTQAFSSIPNGAKLDLNFPNVNYQYENTVNFVNKSDVNQSLIMMGHIGGKRRNPDYAAIQIMNHVLSGGFSGRILKKIRTDLGLSYSPHGQYSMNSFFPGEFYVSVRTKSSTTAEVIKAVKEVIHNLQENLISDKELNDAKDQFLNSLVFRYDSREKILNHRISTDYRGLPEDAFETFVNNLKKVTKADVQRVAQKYLKPDNMQILVVGNKDQIGDQLQQFGKVNTVDISIPQPESQNQKTAQKGDATKGKQWLNKMAKALIKPGAHLNSIKTVGQSTQYNDRLPGGKMSMKSVSTIDFPDEMDTQLNTPQGNMTISLKNGNVTREFMGQKQQLPPSAAKQIKNEINRSYLSIALQKDQLSAEYMGQEKVDGTTYAKLKINLNEPVTFYLDPDNGLPQLMRYSHFSQQRGEQVQVETHYQNWNVVDGVAYAYKEVTYANGDKSSVSEVDTLNVNPQQSK